jgi:hypothetical protein
MLLAARLDSPDSDEVATHSMKLPWTRLTGHSALLLEVPQARARPFRHCLEQADVARIQPALCHDALGYVLRG